ncbi:DUF4392 domain-containing protein [Alkaliphilus crotonatoxidans]
MTAYFDRIHRIVGRDAGNRGLMGCQIPMELANSIEALQTAQRVIIVTGFCIRATMTGETDGPIGAASLAHGLRQLKKEVILITDQYSADLLSGCCEVLGLEERIVCVPFIGAEEFCKDLIRQVAPDLVLAVERPGRAKDGRCYSMKGEDLSDLIPDTDSLFTEAKKLGITTVAIGDGGNEMGMGKLSKQIAQRVYLGEKICAATKADYLITAGVSNWGAHGLVAALSIQTGRTLLHGIQEEIKMLEEIVARGGVDGCSRLRTCTVDGLSLEENLQVLEDLLNLIKDEIPEKSKERIS